MPEKLCLQWNDFKENINSAFGRLREDKEFTDVTLACEDGQKLGAHKVILAASSPFFEKILQISKHPHPLIYLRGFQSKDLVAILDFLYFGEATVYQEDLDRFLAISEELKLKGLTVQTSTDVAGEPSGEEGNTVILELVQTSKEEFPSEPTLADRGPDGNGKDFFPGKMAIHNEFSAVDLQALDEKVKSLMEKGTNMIPDGKQANGKPKQQKASICKICGKEGLANHVVKHIEATHLEGISLPCNICEKVFSSRNALGIHKSRLHRKV